MGKRLWESYCCGKMVVIEKWLLWESDCYGKLVFMEKLLLWEIVCCRQITEASFNQINQFTQVYVYEFENILISNSKSMLFCCHLNTYGL